MSDHASWAKMTLDFMERTPLRDSYLISLWANALSGPAVRSIEKNFKIGRDEFNVMFTLAARGASFASDICQLNSRPKNSISRAVNRLQKRGLIAGETIENDRRKELLSLTEQGRRMYEKTLPAFLERQRELLSPLEYEERRMLEALMKKALLGGPDWRRDV
jgi:DNA-binding MarR family transcriptional regulator